MNWSWGYVWDILPMLLRGGLVTIEATAVGSVIALFVGILFAVSQHSGSMALRSGVRWLVQFIRGTPLLVQLYFIFFVLPDIGLTLPPFFAGVLALGLHYACYMAEVFRAGISSVGQGQWDAIAAVNLKRWQAWGYVVLPQAIPKMLPAMGNYVIGMMKEAALLSAISVHELLSRAQAIGNETFRYTEPLTVVGVIFLVLTLGAAALVRYLERKNQITGA